MHLNSRIKPEAERLRKHETFDVGFAGCLRSVAAERRENPRIYAKHAAVTLRNSAITNLRTGSSRMDFLLLK